jgi:hypothetical protein
MKTFKDLKFEKHPSFGSGFDTRAWIFFGNGYGASVITGSAAYSDSENPYEVAILKGNKEEWGLCYDTPITDNVIGYCNEEKVTDILRKVQELNKEKV